MTFPFDISGQVPDGRGLFLVQDPDLRARILPLFSFNPEVPTDRPQGRATAFRIDPWSRCATAFHVLEDLFTVDRRGTEIDLVPDARLVALDLYEQGYGRLPIPRDAWRPLAGSFTYYRIDLPYAHAASLRNLVELIVLRIRPAILSPNGAPYLPVDLRRWRPARGESVMAIGYADLDAPHADDSDQDRAFRAALFASVGEIIDIEPADATRGRPWPVLRVDANWPGGMSGGPVFNEAGHVIGLVRAGFEGEGGATATYFAGWDVPAQIYGSLDPGNPGHFRCWGVFDADGELVRAGQDRAGIEREGAELGLTDFGPVSVDPVDDCWMRG